MKEGYRVIVIGVLFILGALLYHIRARKNIYNKGWEWFFFALFHGIDEVVDGLNQVISARDIVHLGLEKIEIISFMLSATFLLIGTLIRLNLVDPKDIFKYGFFVQFPLIFLFGFMTEVQIDAIAYRQISIFDTQFSYIALMFGMIPAIPLALAYSFESFSGFSKFKSGNANSLKVVINHLLIAVMTIIYAISELLSSTNVLFLYLEITAFGVILLIPIELNFGYDSNLQLFIMYHRDGMMVTNIKFNTSITEDTLILLSGFLSAINSVVSTELGLGALESVQTNSGILITNYEDEYIYSILVKETTATVKDKFNLLIGELNTEFQLPNDVMDVDEKLRNQIEKRVIIKLSS